MMLEFQLAQELEGEAVARVDVNIATWAKVNEQVNILIARATPTKEKITPIVTHTVMEPMEYQVLRTISTWLLKAEGSSIRN